jgi:hypothetical protein
VPDISSVTKEMTKRLAILLKAQMPALLDVIEDFPEPNEQLKYPCVSIMSGSPTFRPQAPFERNVPEAPSLTNGSVKTKYVVGQYEWKLQLDLWCASKEQRHKLYEQFFNAFNSQWPTMGLSLTLSGYHDEICRYDLTGYKFDDSEAGSQRKEWRATMSVLADCEAVMERNEFVITRTQITLTTPGPEEEIEDQEE